ncbi:MAG: hypothetical protein GX247_00980 [Mollicutes bacterium]|nr:hypothetical protein [Mollicutes bacterium]
MLENVKIELEKEYIINSIEASLNDKLSILERQTLHYILSDKSLKMVIAFVTFYHCHNNKRKIKLIYQEMFEPLLDKKIIVKVRDTKSNMFDEQRNFVYKINEKYIDNNPMMIKRLKI